MNLGPHLKHIPTLYLLNVEVPNRGSKKVASLVTDQAGQRDRPIISAEKIVQHFRLASGIKSEHRPVCVQATTLSGAKEVSSRVKHQTPIGIRPIPSSEPVEGCVLAIARDLEHGSVFMGATNRRGAIKLAGN